MSAAFERAVAALTAPRGKIVSGLPFVDYTRLPGEHASTIKAMIKSPLHYLHASTHDRHETASLRLGRAVHTSVLEPDRFALEYAVYTGPTSGEGSVKARNAWKAANDGKTFLSEDEYALALRVRNAVRKSKQARAFLDDAAGEPEVTAMWTHSESGLACKARFDWATPSATVDVKTTRNIDPGGFSRDVFNLSYHLQFAHYSEGRRYASGDTKPFYAIVVESAAPHDVVVYRVPETLIADGAAHVTDLLLRIAECRAANHWPGVAGDAEQELTLPAWAGNSAKAEPLVLEMPGGDTFAM